MKDLLAAKRYAQALFNVVIAHHMDEAIEAELVAFSESLKSAPELEKFFENPKFTLTQKRKFLARIYQERNHEVYAALVNFFTILLEKNRFSLIHDISVAYKRIADEFQGQATVEIHTAFPLASVAEKKIVGKLETMAGYEIEVKQIVDPKLLGGITVRFKNKIIDGSARHQIDLMKKQLTHSMVF